MDWIDGGFGWLSEQALADLLAVAQLLDIEQGVLAVEACRHDVAVVAHQGMAGHDGVPTAVTGD